MKKLIASVILLICILPTSNANTHYRYKKYRRHEPESGGFAGTKATLNKYAVPVGTEFLYAHSIFHNCFLGCNFGVDGGTSGNTYNAPRFGNDNYGIISANLGLNLDYRLVHANKFSLFMGCLAGYQLIGLDDEYRTSGTLRSFVSEVNGAYSIRPGIGMSITDRMSFGFGYNFLLEDDIDFGTLKDFEGPQIMLSIRDSYKHHHHYYY